MAQDKTSTPVNSQKKAMDLYLAAKAAEAAERDFGKTYIEPLGPGEEITRPDNFLYNALSNPKLNRGLSNIGEAFVGGGTGSMAGDLLVGLTGGGSGIATELAGGESGAIDWIPGGSLAKAGMLGVAKKVANPRVLMPTEKFKAMVDKVNELADRWILAKTEAGEDPMEWFRIPRDERNKFLSLNGVDPKKGQASKLMDGAVKGNYNQMNSDRVEYLLGRDIAELAPEKKAYSTPYMGAIEPPGGATERLLMSPFEDIPEKPAELVNPLTGAVETEAERAAKKSRAKELLARAAELREGALKQEAKRERANAYQREYNQRKREAAKPAVSDPVLKAVIKEAPPVVETPAAIIQKESPAAWSSAEHLLGENNQFRGTPQPTYREVLGSSSDERDRRALYGLDSLYANAAKLLERNSRQFRPNAPWTEKRHKGTNYDDVWQFVNRDIQANRATGNVPESSRIVYRKEPRQYYNDRGELKQTVTEVPYVINEDGTETSLYDLLFKPKRNAAMQRMDF